MCVTATSCSHSGKSPPLSSKCTQMSPGTPCGTPIPNRDIFVAKLQHKNLVRFLGFCLEGKERILVYEYVPNESLDYFLFDPAKEGQLDWTCRYKIICGIARGILYLHQDSRLTITSKRVTFSLLRI
ncbi:BnaC09g54270D [Brassica napus]|uniref:non-specific serine/threonine protein kinase n=2 Tax=Brassica TaxID=3705 RepID=A0A078J3H7_BRANA|nr:BnaC09g54270D [Brassica napus]